MYVTDGKRSWMRGTKHATLKRNGTFIEVRFEEDGVQQIVSVEEKGLRDLLAKKGLQASGDGLVEVREPMDAKTAIADFVRRKSVGGKG